MLYQYMYCRDNVVPVHVLPVFLEDTITLLFIQVRFLWKPHISFSIFTILSTTIRNDIYTMHTLP